MTSEEGQRRSSAAVAATGPTEVAQGSFEGPQSEPQRISSRSGPWSGSSGA